METTSEIRALANEYLKRVKPSGPENVMALCPFHVKSDGTAERHPSFAMSLITGLWFCHSCQAKGNLYTFLRDFGLNRQQIELRYQPLLEAAKRNLPPKPDPARPNVFSTDPIPEGLLGIFEHCPITLLEEGFEERTLKHFGVGFDMSHLRITFPLRDLAGNLVGISGRTVQDYWPKYKIYTDEYPTWELPERINWDKRTVLWNADLIYPQVYFQTEPAYIVVVEGFKAAMWLWQAGITNVVALLSTYLSNEQKWILERMGAPVYLWFDNNYPGQTGLVKTAENLRHSLRVGVIEYPERLIDDEDAQPDSCAIEETREQVRKARNYFDWRAH